MAIRLYRVIAIEKGLDPHRGKGFSIGLQYLQNELGHICVCWIQLNRTGIVGEFSGDAFEVFHLGANFIAGLV